MTPPSSLVVSLENAKALKECGWPQRTSYFVVYTISCMSASASAQTYYAAQEDDLGLLEVDEIYDSPTAEEILRKLPRTFDIRVNMVDDIGSLVARPFTITLPETTKITHGKTEVIKAAKGSYDTLANAAARLYIYCSTHHLL